MKPATVVTTVVLVLIALAHVLRLIFATQVTVAGWIVPVWASAPAAILATVLAIGLWRESAPGRAAV